MIISRKNAKAARSMHDMLAEPIDVRSAPEARGEVMGRVTRLSQARPGDHGVIAEVRAETHPGDHGVGVEELQRRLLEFGFVEGAKVEVLHEGAIRRDPIAVRLDAEDVWVLLDRR